MKQYLQYLQVNRKLMVVYEMLFNDPVVVIIQPIDTSSTFQINLNFKVLYQNWSSFWQNS